MTLMIDNQNIIFWVVAEKKEGVEEQTEQTEQTAEDQKDEVEQKGEDDTAAPENAQAESDKTEGML